MKFLVNIPMPGIKTVIASHFKVFFRYMLDKEFDKINHRKCAFHIGIILVPVIVKGDVLSIVRINSFKGDHRAAKVAADVFGHGTRVAEFWFRIDIKTIFIFVINVSLHFFEGSSDMFFHLVEQSSLESVSEIIVIEMFYRPPKAVIGIAALRNQAMNVGVPFKRTSECMKYTDKPRNKVFGLVDLVKHTENNTANSVKKAVQKRTIFEKKGAKFLVNGKDTMAVSAVYKFKGHIGRTILRIFNAASGAETAFAAERNELHVTAVWTDIHGTAKRRVAAVDHLRDIFHFHISGMKSILNDFIVVFKNML